MTFSSESLPAEQEVTISTDVAQLLTMMSYRRKHGCQTEVDFINDYIIPLPGVVSLHRPATDTLPQGEAMCYMVDVGTPTVVFSSHVDTVHSGGGKQVVKFDANLQVAYKQDNQPLGADDAAGVWLLMQMIHAGVPGRYLFHRGEECGGLGSRMVADHHADIFDGMTHAIAFDRRGDCSVITHQRGGRCCSDAFADELACRLTAATGHTLFADDTGSFTDTANYTDIIGECTNVSVGYMDEHSGKEMLDVEYLLKLRDACCNPALWVDLPVARKAGEYEPRSYGGGGYGSWWDEDWATYYRGGGTPANDRKLSLVDKELVGELTYTELRRASFGDVKDWAMRTKAVDVTETIMGLVDVLSDYESELYAKEESEGDIEAWVDYASSLEDLLEANGIRFDHLAGGGSS